MTVIIINPNSTVSMTEAMVATAQARVPEVSFTGWTSHDGPPSIQGRKDGKTAERPLLDLVVKANDAGAEGIIIGCFDDTALAKAVTRSRSPVIGIGQASYHYAALRGWRFSVVTTLPVSVPIIEENIAGYGLAGHVAKVRASDVPVLHIEDHPERAEARIAEEAETAQHEDGIQAVVLGCAGMVNVADAVRRSVDVAVIDPVDAAASCIRWLCKR